MASSSRDDPIETAMSPASKLMVRTIHGDCQKLKEVLNDNHDSTEIALSPGSKAVPVAPTAQVINPMMLASVSCLLNGKAAPALTIGDETQIFHDRLVAFSNTYCVHVDQNDQEAPHNRLRSELSAAKLKGLTVDGDTVLHALATHGHVDGKCFNICADFICKEAKARDLLFKQNKKGDTPLHCAARAGKSTIVEHLIKLVAGEEKKLLETENELKETALHEAVRIGDNGIVKLLMEKDAELASFPEEGTSPLFLAILLGEDTIVETLYRKSGKNLSYSGQNGQNALHAAVLRGTGLTKKLLEWRKDLTTKMDENGSTPLHFASALNSNQTILQFPWIKPVCWLVLEANPIALYHADKDGLFPIHVAASVGSTRSISIFLRWSVSCAGFRDGAKGRTFLHVAVENGRRRVVSYACRNQFLSWILNMQDNDGNTALHLAVQRGNLLVFSTLFGNTHVRLNITNNKGQTALDIAQHNKISRGVYYTQNNEPNICLSLMCAKAMNGSYRKDHFQKQCAQQSKQDKRVESDKVKDSTQTLTIGSALITTVTFGATFALPGGYRADDHANGGTPTLAGRLGN
ncbi:hypothetical protein GUJ93_ZPchr0002g25219 [Zizania palustris]|uniref:PGG domain-containing protein n=1 Tax=Zizania palustris TaxID=103762 RepID=A0A8J5SCJ9_ZIZPA|nr:hypothetical protein GUJ93_ZPchr0002g25219 [Zizania palustris]